MNVQKFVDIDGKKDNMFSDLCGARVHDIGVLYESFQLPEPRRVLVAGSGLGAEVYAVGKLFGDSHITALDASVSLESEIRDPLSGRVEEIIGPLFHEYIRSNPTDIFDLIIVSTGPSDGITTKQEKQALFSHVTKQGAILTGLDCQVVGTNDDGGQDGFNFEILRDSWYLAYAWVRN